MPYDDPDTTDPMTLNGVMFDTGSDQAVRGMAECFIDEYFRLGYDRVELMKLFKTRGYAGPHLAWQTMGEEMIASMIDEYLQRWGPRRPIPPDGECGRPARIFPDAASQTEGISLPIIDSPPRAHMHEEYRIPGAEGPRGPQERNPRPLAPSTPRPLARSIHDSLTPRDAALSYVEE